MHPLQGYTRESTKRSRNQPARLSVLGERTGADATREEPAADSEVTLSELPRTAALCPLVTRTAGDESPRASERFVRPIILSQTEIETVGLQAQGRLSLLDSFIDDQRDADAREAAAASEVRSLTTEAEALRREIEDLVHQLEEIPALENQILDLSPKEQQLARVSAAANEKKTRLDAISSNIATSAVGLDALERFHQAVSRWLASLSDVAPVARAVEPWPDGAGPDPLTNCRAGIQRARDYLNKAVQELHQASLEARTHLQSTNDNKLKIEDQARHLRKEIEALQVGAGTIIRHGQQLRERRARLDYLEAVLKERNSSLEYLLAKRGAALDKLDEIREKRFRVRNRIATKLDDTLGPHIRVEAFRAGQCETFAAAISDTLRGSGLRYNELSSMLADNISPRELLEAADTNDIDLIAEATGITKDRATRALTHLRESHLGTLATVDVEDTVSLQLLDGAVYKGIGELSTGQRCTVILPLVLRHTDRIVIVDQPEDHIDNAFIAETLIRSVLSRNPDGQVIFSTHNANIPVLGNADQVVQLGSDGKRGFTILASYLNDSSVVDAITTVMEGGAEAFERRASFYNTHATS